MEHEKQFQQNVDRPIARDHRMPLFICLIISFLVSLLISSNTGGFHLIRFTINWVLILAMTIYLALPAFE